MWSPKLGQFCKVGSALGQIPDGSKRMALRHPRVQVAIAEQAAVAVVLAPHGFRAADEPANHANSMSLGGFSAACQAVYHFVQDVRCRMRLEDHVDGFGH